MTIPTDEQRKMQNIPYEDGSPSDDWVLDEIEIPKYEDMTREELIDSLNAHDDHHQEHHENEKKLQLIIDNRTVYEELDKARARISELEKMVPERVTVEGISQDIQRWKFDDDSEGPFGNYLRTKYPNGLVIVEGGG